jgi:hypothetical protein
MSFEEQDAAMMTHLAEKHPDWMTDGGASILKHRVPGGDIKQAVQWLEEGNVIKTRRLPNRVIKRVEHVLYSMSEELYQRGATACWEPMWGFDMLMLQATDYELVSDPRAGSTVHDVCCTCGFCKMGSTRL